MIFKKTEKKEKKEKKRQGKANHKYEQKITTST